MVNQISWVVVLLLDSEAFMLAPVVREELPGRRVYTVPHDLLKHRARGC